MLLSLLTGFVVWILIFLLNFVGAYGQVEQQQDACVYPEMESAYFDEDGVRQKPPKLHTVNSTSELGVEIVFPYQFILMTCNAPYPIEWISDDAPQHYYFSYVLDDEVRTVVKDQGKYKTFQSVTLDKPYSGNYSEVYTIRLHIGNETLNKNASKMASIICQAVEDNSCGITLASVYKKNKTLLSMRFSKIPLFSTKALNANFVEAKEDSRNQKNNCFANSKSVQCTHTWAGEKDFPVEKFSDDSYSNSSYCDLDFSARSEINTTSLLSPSGIITCESLDAQRKRINEVPYIFSLPKLCPNEDTSLPHLYYGKSIPKKETNPVLLESEFLSLCVQNASIGDIYVGDKLLVTCISSIFYFAQGLRLQVAHNHTIEELGLTDREYSFGSAGFRNLTTTFTVSSNYTQKVKCYAPLRKSRNWLKKLVHFTPKVPVKVSLLSTVDTAITNDTAGVTFLTCNATGDPMPKLVWSRLNNQELPTNQTTINFNGNATTNETAWISSTLYFPVLPEGSSGLSKYFGRYICTASNKFDSIEKVFLFDERNNQDAESILGDNMSFTKMVWFWVIVSSAMMSLVATVMWLGFKLRKQAQKVRLFSRAEIDEFLFGKPELLLDDTDMYADMNSYAAYLPYDTNQFEIQREQLEFNPAHILGTGAYGTVYKGVFTTNYGEVKPVAIKTVSPTSDKTYFAALLSEIKIMCYIGKHQNVIRLVGACTKYLDQRQIFVATEYCPNGDILSYMLKNRETFINNASLNARSGIPNLGENGPGNINGYCKLGYSKLMLSPHLLVMWALQIAQGMSYLSSKKVIHGDLAARNVLLAQDLKPKIGDFGLSKQLQKYANYVRKGDDLLPWKWLAIECLQFMKFSVQSDVWAFGILLFELFSLGQVPYANHTYSELFIVSLCQGERLRKPEYASDELYGLMLKCWNHFPENRPAFSSLEAELSMMANDSERKMLMSISNTSSNSGLPESTMNPTTTTNSSYVSHAADQEIVQLFSNSGSDVSRSIDIFPTNSSYVNHSSEIPIHLAPPPSQTSSYIDWTASLSA